MYVFVKHNYALTPCAKAILSYKMCFNTTENRACRRRRLWQHMSTRGPDGHQESKQNSVAW